ncbi:hypothetical protein EIN_032560 [Entamoeba invadens IP1]|uniref:GPN-loop GTPase 2 n=1 Tax=Entamoeba invadens IP1 TaxID=370355 RepID=A0A0A1TYA0_ENTIV|nr:hypothetical protein EIN_032560 [Entamoeba invadens IP1]ELP86465.1 hypothetical protein EIN_032560 [Entamoeba invadens IP1]|eukprot:XP_004185811.1 hypothetical protein EIN_032560 [Entamoeba invadens IP1]
MQTTCYGQVITGAPGCGKTTFVKGMFSFLSLMGRTPLIVNLDPANEPSEYTDCVSLPSLLSLDEAMTTTALGPNGGMLYCLEYLESNVDWMLDKIAEKKATYLLIDCPGQTELFSTHEVLPRILHKMLKMKFQLTAVHLIDSVHIGDPSIYIAAMLQTLACNMNFELPFVTFLSKADLIGNYGFKTKLDDLINGNLKDESFDLPDRLKKLSEKLAEVVDDYALIRPVPFAVEDKDDLALAVALVDKANGYTFNSNESSVLQYFQVEGGVAVDVKIDQTIEKYQALIDG